MSLFFNSAAIASQYCGNCRELYNTAPKPGHDEQFPEIFCDESHAFCKRCCSQLKQCPTCGGSKAIMKTDHLLEELEQNKQVLFAKVPTISFGDIEQESEPHAYGSSAEVFCCQWNGTTVALKKLKIELTPIDLILHEAKVGFNLRHPNIIQMFGLTQLRNSHWGIVMEWANHGSLSKHMASLGEIQKIQVAICICRGLLYLHSLRIAHRDLKPQNVLLFGDKSRAKISDFGTSKVAQTIPSASSSVFFTAKYAAPELMQRGNCLVWINKWLISA